MFGARTIVAESLFMYASKSILGIIPARAGSKGIPKKNLRPIAGQPLICWTIEQCRKSRFLDKVVVSTDGEEIADVSRSAGADVPFLRPVAFAADSSPTSDVVLHALEFFENIGEYYDFVAILEPTSPLRKPTDIDRGIQTLAESEGADTLVTVGEVHTEHPLIVKRIENNRVVPYMPETRRIYQRQQADKAFFPYGVLYLSRCRVFKKSKTFYTEKTLPLLIDRWQNYEIDDETDFLVVENLIKKYREEIG